MGKNKKKFVIIDAMALAYKAYFAFINRPLTTSSGEPTSAVFGFLNQLFKILEDTKPDHIAIAFDAKEKTFRHDMFEKYKSSRSDMPDDMIPQIKRIKEVIEYFKIESYILPGYEADDLIGTAVRKAEALGYESYMITPDKDFIQLVTENVKLIRPGGTGNEIEIIDKSKVKEQFGFEPVKMIDYLALVGDSSDDIPGVKGVGPKSAIPLIQEFGSVEGIYDNLDNVNKKGIRNKLEENREDAFISKKLATIMCDVDFDCDIDKALRVEPDRDNLLKFFSEMEFKNFGARLNNLFNSSAKPVEEEIEPAGEMEVFSKENSNYKLIKTFEEAEKLAAKLRKSEVFVFDTETDSLHSRKINLAGCAFSTSAAEAYFVATNPYYESRTLFQSDLSDRLSVEDFVKIFKPVFEEEKIKKVCQNGKYDISVLKNFGITTNNFYFDTMLASYVLDPDQKHGMDDLAERYLNYSPIPILEIIESKKTPEKIFEADCDALSDYSCEDADITFRLYEILSEELKKEELEKLAYEVEFPLVEVLEDMERTGVKIDKQSLKKLSDDLEILMNNYTKRIFELAGEEFNINSTKQLQQILFYKLELPFTKKTKTGFSTDARSLESLRGKHEIVDIIQDFRQATKLKSTYADSLPNLIDPSTGRIHTTYNQSVVATGRLSSLDPNLQNIPIRTDMGKEIRKAFVARDDEHLILSADYSQIELRIMASISGDERLIEAFTNGEDIHRRTAALVFMCSPEDVTPDMRRKAKEVNFGILYGIGAFGLKTRLGITQSHAKEIIDNYFATFKNVKEFMDQSVKLAQEKGYAETLSGRRRYLRNINSGNRVVRQFEERVAINMPIQGTAADMIKLAMINIYRELKKRNTKTKMVLQVHDELIFDAHRDEIEELKPVIINLMETALPLNVPIAVDSGTGKSWLEAH